MAKKYRSGTATQNSAKTETKSDPKAEKKAANKAKRAKKKAALTSVLVFVKENSEDKKLLAAVKLLTPGQRFGGTRVGVIDVIAKIFTDVDSVDENQLWEDHKLGRKELRGITVNLIKKREPKNRMWISFDSEAGIYTLEGTGAKAPRDWAGYTPVDMEDMEI